MVPDVRVLSVIPDERLGGPQYRVLQVARNLRDSGFTTIVAIPEGDKEFAVLLDEADILCCQLRSFKRLPSSLAPLAIIKWLLWFIPGVIALIRLIRKWDVKIVHANGSMSLQAPLAARLSKCRLVWHLNDTLTPRVCRMILYPFLRLLPHKIAVASDAVAQYYLGSGAIARKAELLYPPIDTAKFRPDGTGSSETRRELAIAEDEKVVGIVGNINLEKGHEYFLMAAKTISERFSRVKFLLVGKRLETQERQWEKVISLIRFLGLDDDVIMAGHRTDIPEIMNLLDVFVLASTSEAAPIVVLEAMACARPVVATRVGGVPEMVIDGKTGIIVPAKDADAISAAVVRLLSNREEAVKMGLEARKRAVEYFDIASCTRLHQQIYKDMI